MRHFHVLLVLATWTFSPAVAADPAKEARKNEAEKRFTKLKSYCQERLATHVTELLAEWGEFADQQQQDEVLAMAEAIFNDARAELKSSAAEGGNVVFPKVGRRGVSADADLARKATFATTYLVDEYRAEQPQNKPGNEENVALRQVVIAARTLSVRPNDPAEECVLLTNAATAGLQGVQKCVVLASGDLEVDWKMTGAVVVCRGNIRYRFGEGGKESSLVKAGGAVEDVRAAKLAAQGKAIPPPDAKRVFAKDANLLGVKFYTSAEDGVEVSVEKNVVTVVKLDATKPFAKAGVKEGDIVEAVNAEKVGSQHELDRLLVRATVASGIAKLKVQRRDGSAVVEVKLADW
jgi:PDZ domain